MRVTKKVKAEQLRRLSEVYKNDGTMLHFTSPFTLLVAVILSAQCTDKSDYEPYFSKIGYAGQNGFSYPEPAGNGNP